MLRTDGKKIEFRTRFATTIIEPYGPNCLRCRSTRNRTVSEERWTLLEPLPASCTVVSGESSITLTNGDLSVKVEDSSR